MKNKHMLIAAFLCGTALFASDDTPALPLCEWSFIWSGAWEKTSSISLNRTIHNQAEAELNLLPLGLLLRTQILDRRTINLDLANPWTSPVREVTNFTGGFYHTSTDSRLLFGVLDEWGLPARIRNPWIRSPPYAENHRPSIANLRTEASSTRIDEAYLYLSSPFLSLYPNLNYRCFGSVQMPIEDASSGLGAAFSGGADFIFNRNTNLLLETFYTSGMLPPSKPGTWFSSPTPALPQREFRLYAAGLLYKSANFSISSDLALSETFAWGTDTYANLGISYSPPFSIGNSGRLRPFLISIAADKAGERFVYRDGASRAETGRCGLKIEWRGRYNALARADSVLRTNKFDGSFNRSSTGFYYRSPVRSSGSSVIRLARLSFSADRNAENNLKINDSFSGTVGLGINLRQIGLPNPLRFNISGSIKGLSESDNPSPFPIPEKVWNMDSAALSFELIIPVSHIQIRSKAGYTFLAEKNDKLDFSVSAMIRFKQGRLSLRMESPDFPEKWNWNISWRMIIQGKS
ncbi:MAG: hypothetical protein FWD40_05745 [Treponema sp.]|nr:hypothetical protein [Treponema sp.]